MKIGIPGTVVSCSHRNGGYINYQYQSQNPGGNDSVHMFDQEEANQMLHDADIFIQNYFPWMKDFIIMQLSDGTIRLDVADRKFLDK